MVQVQGGSQRFGDKTRSGFLLARDRAVRQQNLCRERRSTGRAIQEEPPRRWRAQYSLLRGRSFDSGWQ